MNSISKKCKPEKIDDITEDGVKYHLARMKKKNIIKRVGPAKGGDWEVVEDD